MNLVYASAFWRGQIVFAFGWAIVVALCVFWHLTQHGWFVDEALWAATMPYFFGGISGGYFGLYTSSAFARRRPTTAKFAFAFAALTIFTIGFTTLMFVVQHRLYFAQWHSDFPSIAWLFQLIFTGLGSIYLFAISGLRPLLPWGILILALASWAFSRGWLPGSR